MKDLAAASDVSVKTLYNLYSSKDELLLAAVVDLLADLAEQPEVQSTEPGVARLLANVQATSRQVVATPEYADTMARALFQAGKDHRLVDVLLGATREGIQTQLEAAQQQGELLPQVDIQKTATLLTGHQWSVVLMWSKGLLNLEEFEQQAQRSQLQTLIPLCSDEIRARLESQLW